MSKFANKIDDIYNISSDEEFIQYYYNNSYFPKKHEKEIKDYFIYTWKYAKNLNNENPFRSYALGVCHYLVSNIFICDNIPISIKSYNKRLLLFQLLPSPENAIKHIIDIFDSSINHLSKFENLDINSEIYKLCVDDYISSLIKQTTLNDIELDHTLELIKKEKERDIKINSITK